MGGGLEHLLDYQMYLSLSRILATCNRDMYIINNFYLQPVMTVRSI